MSRTKPDIWKHHVITVLQLEARLSLKFPACYWLNFQFTPNLFAAAAQCFH